MALFPIVNGKAYDYSAIQTVLPLMGIVKHITEINYSDSLERGEFRGQAPHAIAMTNGQYSAEGSLIIEKQHHAAFMAALSTLAAPFGGDIRAVKFPITAIYAAPGMPIVNDKLVQCQYNGSEQGNSQGSDALVVTVNLAMKAVFWNGVNPLGLSGLDLGVSV